MSELKEKKKRKKRAMFTGNTTPELEIFGSFTAVNSFQERAEEYTTPNCRHCYGRGYVGKKVGSGFVIPCKCVLKNYASKKEGVLHV